MLKVPDNDEVVPRPQAFKWSKRLAEGQGNFKLDGVMQMIHLYFNVWKCLESERVGYKLYNNEYQPRKCLPVLVLQNFINTFVLWT